MCVCLCVSASIVKWLEYQPAYQKVVVGLMPSDIALVMLFP